MSYATIFSDKWVKKTFKNHRCNWCDEIIKSGGLARRTVGVFEGDFFSEYMHPECHYAYLEYFKRPENKGESFEYFSFARGRTDSNRNLTPEFNKFGIRTVVLPIHEIESIK